MEYFGYGKPSEFSSVVGSVNRWCERWNVSPFSWFSIFTNRTNEFIGACGISPPNKVLIFLFFIDLLGRSL